jgi:hypothetical protein
VGPFQRRVKKALERIMRRPCILSILVLVASQITAAGPCKPKVLRPEVLEKIKPLLELRIKQDQDQLTFDGYWKGESPHTPRVEKRFEEILSDRSNAGDEAVAYLLFVYMGDHPAEEMECELIERGQRMLPIIDRYDACLPLTGLEPLPPHLHGPEGPHTWIKKRILGGQKCEWGD